MTISLDRIKQAREAVAHTEHFSMEHWFGWPDGGDRTFENAHVPDALPCGTTACIAGTIQHRFAVGECQRSLEPATFAKSWLCNVDALSDVTHAAYALLADVFVEPMLYGARSLAQVTKADVLRVLDKIIQMDNPALTVHALYAALDINVEA